MNQPVDTIIHGQVNWPTAIVLVVITVAVAWVITTFIRSAL